MGGPKRLVRDEGGQALFEMGLTLFFYLIVFLGVLAFAPRVYVRLAVDTAAYDCATAAVETLNPVRGVYQGRTAAMETLNGFRLPASRVKVQIWGVWARGQPVTCQIGYTHAGSFLPWMDSLFPGAWSKTRGRVTLLVETFKSQW
ncbi:MAG TPA: hypothetical protein EYP77_02710 [Anaerolineae bacterium]|nr:hypothetical protein [Anaerolineae bacterium]